MYKTIKPTLVLLIITFVVTFCIAAVNNLTKDIISERAARDALEQRKQVMKEATEFRDVSKYIEAIENAQSSIINEIYAGYNGEKFIGYVFKLTPKGYAGNIDITVGIVNGGEISRVIIGQHKETPGLGSLAAEDDFINQFIGKKINKILKIVKREATKDDEIQAVSGATITSKAVNSAVNLSSEFAAKLFENGGEI